MKPILLTLNTLKNYFHTTRPVASLIFPIDFDKNLVNLKMF